MSEPENTGTSPEAEPAVPAPPPGGGQWAAPDAPRPAAAPEIPFPATEVPATALPGAYPVDAHPGATPPKPRRTRVLWISGAGVLVLALVAGGIYALLPGRTGNSVVAKVDCAPAKLASCLIEPPAGAQQLTASAPWDETPTPGSDLFAAAITQDAGTVRADTTTQLSKDGMTQIVHSDWNAVDGDDVDLVLLAFTTQAGAQAWNSARSAEILAAYRGRAVSIPGDSVGKAYAAAKADAQGEVDAAYSAVVGDVVLNVAYSSPKQFSARDLQTWAGTELASLRTAPAPAPDPAPVAPGTEQVACGGRPASCLMPKPSGGERWSSPFPAGWVSGSTLTPKQFVTYFWHKSDQSAVEANFSEDGVTAIAHEDWGTDDFDKQADIYLVQTITAVGADALDSSNFGEPEWDPGEHGTAVSIPGQSTAEAWYGSKKDDNGFIAFYFTESVGNVIVAGWLYFYGHVDSGTAKSWAESELKLVNQHVKTEPMGLFPLATPKLPDAAQGACSAAGDCLLPLPAGAKDTTGADSSYDIQKAMSAVTYAGQDESEESDDFAAWLTSDGFRSGEHRSWTAGGAAVDAVLLKYGSPAQARAATLLEYGSNAVGDRVCTDSAVPDSMCLAEPVDSGDYLQDQTVWVLAWKGDYEVSVSVTTSNRADIADAYAAAQQQLDLLPAN